MYIHAVTLCIYVSKRIVTLATLAMEPLSAEGEEENELELTEVFSSSAYPDRKQTLPAWTEAEREAKVLSDIALLHALGQ